MLKKDLGIKSTRNFHRVIRELVEDKGFIDIVEPGNWYQRKPTKYSISILQERAKRVCEILVRGIYLHAEDEGWLKKPELTLTDYPKKKNRSTGDKDIIRSSKCGAGVRLQNEKYYSVTQAAKILNVSKRTVQRWVSQGKLTAEKKDNGYLVIRYQELILARNGLI